MNRCSITVSGEHEPNIVRKDNDLKYKLRLSKLVARETMLQIAKDANFLHSVKVMDYSLLGISLIEYLQICKEYDWSSIVGVHNAEYDVEPLRARRMTEDASTRHSDLFQCNKQLDVRFLILFVLYSMFYTLNVLFYRFEQVGTVTAPQSYLIGIIDFQQKWTWSKKVILMRN